MRATLFIASPFKTNKIASDGSKAPTLTTQQPEHLNKAPTASAPASQSKPKQQTESSKMQNQTNTKIK